MQRWEERRARAHVGADQSCWAFDDKWDVGRGLGSGTGTRKNTHVLSLSLSLSHTHTHTHTHTRRVGTENKTLGSVMKKS